MKKQLVKNKSLLLAAIAMLGFILLFYGPGMPNIAKLQMLCPNYNIPDASLGYTEASIKATFECWGNEGMEIYSRIQIIDMFFPLAYVFFLYVLLTKAGLNRKMALALPSIAGAADYIENIIIWNQRISFPELNTMLISIANILTYLKYSFILICIFIILGSLFSTLYKWSKEIP
jgi:hypothetical protein